MRALAREGFAVLEEPLHPKHAEGRALVGARDIAWSLPITLECNIPCAKFGLFYAHKKPKLDATYIMYAMVGAIFVRKGERGEYLWSSCATFAEHLRAARGAHPPPI